MEYEIKAKPIVYKKRLYRSRLEARWAAFFDLVEWDYEYEPVEVNYRNPDFFIKCKSNAYPTNTILVEIRPSVYLTKEYINKAYNDYKNEAMHLLFLTESPFYKSTENFGQICIGVGAQHYNMLSCNMTEILEIEMKGIDDFGSTYMAFDGMVNGKIDRKYFSSYNEVDKFKNLWAEAANEIMFLKP